MELARRMLGRYRERIGWALVWLGIGSATGIVGTFFLLDEEAGGVEKSA